MSAESLDSPRLSVKHGLEPSESKITQDVPFGGSITVAEGDTRRPDTWTEATYDLNDYLTEKSEQRLVLADENDNVQVIPHNHRFTAHYRDKVYAKLKDAERALDDRFQTSEFPSMLFGLTAPHRTDNGDPRDPVEVLDDLLDAWDTLRKSLDYHLPDDRVTEYLRVIEPHKTGYPHLHLAIFGVSSAELADKIVSKWLDLVDGADHRAQDYSLSYRGSRDIESPAGYLMKYLSKTMVRESGKKPQNRGFERFAALLLATGKRQFSSSQWLSAQMKSDSSSQDDVDWRYVGTTHTLKAGYYGAKAGKKALKHMTSDVWHKPPDPTDPLHAESEQTGL